MSMMKLKTAIRMQKMWALALLFIMLNLFLVVFLMAFSQRAKMTGMIEN